MGEKNYAGKFYIAVASLGLTALTLVDFAETNFVFKRVPVTETVKPYVENQKDLQKLYYVLESVKKDSTDLAALVADHSSGESLTGGLESASNYLTEVRGTINAKETEKALLSQNPVVENYISKSKRNTNALLCTMLTLMVSFGFTANGFVKYLEGRYNKKMEKKLEVYEDCDQLG
ncbi:MAG: hypothetical protein ACP5N3_05370 [Candidatus Nanoarchaeia archaeon]